MDRHWLAADFFLIAHDEFSGKLRISPDLLCCGLVGGQLADLIVANRLAVEGGRVLVTDDRSEARDEVGDYVVESISRQTSTHSVRVWVETLQEVLYELIGRRLINDGVVRREQGGRQLMRRRPDRFPATDLLAAARPRLRLEHMLRTPQEFDLPGAILAVLVGAVGVETVLDPEIDRTAARELTTRLEENFPADLRALIEGVRAAAVAVSLTVRR
jgi:Golgi phosphoprotein 3 (GPP34)